jgi:DNA polymerase
VSIITIDFETYYDKDYSLSKMTTEEYINDPRFEVIGMGFKMDDGPTEWYVGDEVKYVLMDMDCSSHAILCHNTLFDGAILSWKYGIKPGMWFDTLCMARAIHGVDAGGSLKQLASQYQLGEKGEEVIHALGKRRTDFTDADLSRYGMYCRNDVDLTYSLFDRLSSRFPDMEYSLIDFTIRMYTEPAFQVDDALLISKLEDLKHEKTVLLSTLKESTGAEDEEGVRKILSSNPKFADVLRKHGVEPPTKTSPTTGKSTYAFAKTDQGFIDLQGHDNPAVQQICGVRLGTKSTLEESRIERFIGIGGRNRGYLPVPLRYYGAHTGRWSGTDSVNFQNLPSRDKNKKALKNAIVPPPGYTVVNADSSQIEARVLAWLAGQDDLVEQFRNGEDVYSTFASKVYGYPVSKATPVERFVGKTCILGLGYGTGAAKLQHTLKLGGADLPIERCKEIVDLYRRTAPRIPALWAEGDRVLERLLSWPEGVSEYVFGQHGAITVTTCGLRLPNTLGIYYNNLKRTSEDGFTYTSRRGVKSLWGGSVVENAVQALARIVIGHQMIALNEQGFRPNLTVHDSLVYVIPDAKRDTAVEAIQTAMSTPPAWATGLPVACEVKYGKTYGDC